MRSSHFLRLASTFVVTLMLCTTVQAAGLFRAYLSLDGDDTGPCTLLQPCRLLPAALNAVADGGEIWMVDSANYGTGINITKSVTILAVPGALGSVTANGGNAMRINAAGVNVTLRNLVIVPVVGSAGGHGVSMTAGAKLTVENCLIANVPLNGIVVTTAASVRITDTTIRDSGENGVVLATGTHATITRATISGNRWGVVALGATADATTADIGDSTLDGNRYGGVYALAENQNGTIKVSVHGSRIVQNAGVGVTGDSHFGGAVALSVSNNIISNNDIGIFGYGASTKVWASGNTVSHNRWGLQNDGGLFESAGNNAVRNNSADTVGAITVIATK
jgi:hypothetical protein